MSRDDIFKFEKIEEDFVFNEQVAEVFDDMLDRSIPFYRQIIDMTVRLLEENLQPGDRIFDLGCSTGTTLLTIAECLQVPALKFVGVDSSPSMIMKAEEKAGKLAGRLMFPRILFIFSSLFVAILGPAAIRIYQTMIQP